MKASLILYLFLSCCSLSIAQEYQLKPEHAEINWVGMKLTGQHEGEIKLKSGQVSIENEDQLSGKLDLNMQSIRIIDIPNPKSNKKLMDVFNSESFFNPSNYPTATIKITETKSIQEDSLIVKALLKIKSIEREIQFKTAYRKTNEGFSTSGTIKINRQDFDIRYGSGFLDRLGDAAIKDIFLIHYQLNYP